MERASHREYAATFHPIQQLLPKHFGGDGGDLWVALVARLMSNTNKTSEDADFFAFPCHVTSFRSWMGRTDRPDKHSSHPAVTLLGTAQASRANFSSSLWVSLVCFVLLPIT